MHIFFIIQHLFFSYAFFTSTIRFTAIFFFFSQIYHLLNTHYFHMHFSLLPFVLRSSFFFSQIYRLLNTYYFHMHFSLLPFVLQPSFFLQSNLPFVQLPLFSYAFSM